MPEPSGKFTITWRDSGREPQCPANPDYPDGKDLDGSGGASLSCTVALPYPAKRCGAYLLRCLVCGITAGVTTAGRRDDPRSITLACRAMTRA
jgi:hypothetical protein